MARRRRASDDAVSFSRLDKALEKGRIVPVYVLLGEEDFLRLRAFEAIVGAVTGVTPEQAGMALESVDLTGGSVAGALDVARSLPLFLEAGDGPSRVVRVTGFEGKHDDDPALLDAYLERPVEATCLVFDAPDLDKRRSAVKALLSAATVVDCAPPRRESDVRRWVQGAAQSRGFSLPPEAIAYLLETVGADLQRLHQELEKIALYVGEDGEVAARDLEALMGRSREYSVFELTDELVEGDADGALTVLNHLLDDGEAPPAILGMITWIVRQMVIAGDLAARGRPEKEVLGQLGGRWDTRRQVLSRVRRTSVERLEGLLASCAEADEAAKVRSGGAGRGALEVLCRRICAA